MDSKNDFVGGVCNPDVNLTDEQVTFFRENGYLSIPRITTDEEIEWLKGIYDELFTERTGEAEGRYFDLAGPRAHSGRETLPQVLGPEAQFPELRETVYFRNAHRFAAKLLGVEAEKVNGGGHMILKPAHYGNETPWHQDEAYWNPEIVPHSLSVWLPLDKATVESGCLQFIPQSHKGKVRWHRHINNDPAGAWIGNGRRLTHQRRWRVRYLLVARRFITVELCTILHQTLQQKCGVRIFSFWVDRRGNRINRRIVPWQTEEQEALAQLKSLAKEQ